MSENKDNTSIVKQEDYDVIELPVEMEGNERAQYDIQISTAKKYPRNITKAVNSCVAIVTRSEDAAKKCNYSLPRGGKSLTGKSVHLARLLAQNWGNIRAESKVVGITDKQVISEAVCFDLETNYAVKFQVRKSIIGKFGRFTEDMIVVTGNAANAIAYRNAVLAIIPEQISDEVYQAAMNKMTGDLSTEQRIIAKRQEMLEIFKNMYNVTEKEILTVLNKQTVNQILKDEIVTLIGLEQAIKDGDTTVEQAFLRNVQTGEKKDKVEGILKDDKEKADKPAKEEKAKPGTLL